LANADERFGAFVPVCAFGGPRLGEAAALRVDDVDFLRRTIAVRRQVQGQTNNDLRIVPPKHGSERIVYVPEELVTMLSVHVRDFGAQGGGGMLFSSSGHALNRNSAGNLWNGPARLPGSETSRCTTSATSTRRG